MSLAARTRSAVDERPFLHTALRAGIVNYSAAARTLPVEGDEEAVATALRRYAEDLPPLDVEQDTEVRVRMESGLEWTDDATEPILSVGDGGLAGNGDRTAIVATGSLSVRHLSTVLDRLTIEDVDIDGAGATTSVLVVSVPRSEGATALRIVEETLSG